MQDLLGIGTNRRESMIGVGIGLGLSGYRLPFSTGFSPSLIPGLQLWLDSSDLSTLYQSIGGSIASADGDPVGQWMDKSGNLRNAVQSDGTKKPALKMSIKNSKPAIRFDGVNDFLQSTISLSQPATYFVACKRSSLPSASIVDLDGGSTGGRMIVYSKSTGQWSMYAGSAEVYSGTRDTNWHTHSAIFNGASSTRYLDSASIATGNPGSDSVSAITVGSNNTGGENFVGDMLEVLVYDSALSTIDRLKVEGYLNTKWSIY